MAVVAAGAVFSAGLGSALTTAYGAVAAAAIQIGVMAAASVIDQKVIMPALIGKPREQAQTPRLLGVPIGTNDPGAPRVYAFGRRVRVPVHILWQDEKIREGSSNRHKSGMSVTQRQVHISALYALNDRPTSKLAQLIGNGKLLLQDTLNTVTITTHEFDITESGGDLTLEMRSFYEPEWSEKFEVDDILEFRNVVTTTPGLMNSGYWKIVTVGPHNATPSRMTVKPYTGQTVAGGTTGHGGFLSSPAVVYRVDDALASHTIAAVAFEYGWGTTPNQHPLRMFVEFVNLGNLPIADPRDLFRVGDRVFLNNYFIGQPEVEGRIGAVDQFSIKVGITSITVLMSSVPATFGVDRNSAWLSFVVRPTSATSLFPAGFDPGEHYFSGTETQTAWPVMEAIEGAGEVPGYRGMACQGLEQLYVTPFGDSLPFAMEAVLDVDTTMTLPEALVVLCERGGVPRHFVDTNDVPSLPFNGMFVRGVASGATNLMPVLMAEQLATQDRDGVLCFFPIEEGDPIGVRNSDYESHLGARIHGEEPVEKAQEQEVAREDLPTSIGVRHQDPDNVYAEGYQHFGIRNPSSSDEENRQELDLSNMVLSRKAARNLSATVMRRAHTNAKRRTFTLPANYLDTLENDLHIITDDDGVTRTYRITQREIGSNYLVRCTAVQESVDLQVYGTGVQMPDVRARRPVVFSPIVSSVLDLPPLEDSHGIAPGLYLAACTGPGGTWGGASVYASTDSEQSWLQVAVLSGQHAIGISTDVLDGGTPAEWHGTTEVFWDVTNELTVEFSSLGPEGALYSVTEADAVDGRFNWLALLDQNTGEVEILAAKTVQQNSATNYTFSDLLRGLRGTWTSAVHFKPSGLVVVSLRGFLQTGAFVPFLGFSAANGVATVVSTRFLAPGQDINSVQSVTVPAQWRNARPFPLRVLTKTIGAAPDYDARFETHHWTRRNLPLGDIGPYPMDESFEEYKFTIYDPTGQSVRRIKTVTARGSGSPTLRDKWVDYPNAEQVADGYTPGAATTFIVDVQQVGDYGISDSVKAAV